MAALTSIALGTLAAASAYGAYSSYEGARFARSQASDVKRKERKASREEERNRLQSAMLMQRRRGAISEPGQRETILTSPMGAIGQPAQVGKTLLGA